MLIQHIFAKNYKTYLTLDLDISVTDSRPIILIGGANGGGKTTLFEAIYGALYGLDIKSEQQFRELFNAGVKDYESKEIVLEISFTGIVLGIETPYKIHRTYKMVNNKPMENVTLFFDSTTYSYGPATPINEKKVAQMAINKVIDGNLPKELSNYFLFDAMKTGELVKEEEINNLIRKNINSVMGFNKYLLFRKAAEKLLSDEKAKRLDDKEQEREYKKLVTRKDIVESDLVQLRIEYDKALQRSSQDRESYERMKKGEENDTVLKNKIESINKQLANLKQSQTDYRTQMENTIKGLETDVVIPRLASVIVHEIEQILNVKDRIEENKKNFLSEKQISDITQKIVAIIRKNYHTGYEINIEDIVEEIRLSQESPDQTGDRYYFLDNQDIDTLKEMLRIAGNPMTILDNQKRRLDLEVSEEAKLKENVEHYKMQISGSNHEFIKEYEENEARIRELKAQIDQKQKDIADMESELQSYDYQVPQIPDPKYDLLQKLPDFFKDLSSRLLLEKKHNIEQKMREYLNINLVAYKDTIGRVQLSETGNENEIQFKMYHRSGNEIYLNQLNAGSKQMVMQVLLKVLYELGDYNPPVMIDTVMGVMDKASRETVLEHYFPDLAQQTILLSTDTEITADNDFVKIAPFVAKVYTLHRDLDKQCTTVSQDYFGLQLNNY